MSAEGVVKEFSVKGNEACKVKIFKDKTQLGEFAAAGIAARLKATIASKGNARLILATGASQYEFLDALRTKDVDWSKVTAFHLDEYIGLADDHPASFRKYLKDRIFNHLNFGAVHLLDGNADPTKECARYEALLKEGPIDAACIGIGENGHLAFNDPPADFNTEALVHVVTLDEKCRKQQVGEGHFATLDDVPKQALSISVPGILRAEYISCAVPDERKAEAVVGSIEGSVDPGCPGSALQNHKDCLILLDGPAASKLTA
eukprot:TRINITY_DN67676_c4_g2_i2.p1 TRINITY_DN67676_c4_g2~~TRINITY_DN67676_c4_g2_i2.p1  ORF type:complete len:261 (-),score=39.98 TRINITY_DN67676_c4_g2_i2:145-927(-)